MKKGLRLGSDGIVTLHARVRREDLMKKGLRPHLARGVDELGLFEEKT